MIHVVGNAAIDTVIRVDTFPAAGRDDCRSERGRGSRRQGRQPGDRAWRAADRRSVSLAARRRRCRRRADPETLWRRRAFGLDGIRVWRWSDRPLRHHRRPRRREHDRQPHRRRRPISIRSPAKSIGARGRVTATGSLLQGNLRASVTRACLAWRRGRRDHGPQSFADLSGGRIRLEPRRPGRPQSRRSRRARRPFGSPRGGARSASPRARQRRRRDPRCGRRGASCRRATLCVRRLRRHQRSGLHRRRRCLLRRAGCGARARGVPGSSALSARRARRRRSACRVRECSPPSQLAQELDRNLPARAVDGA